MQRSICFPSARVRTSRDRNKSHEEEEDESMGTDGTFEHTERSYMFIAIKFEERRYLSHIQ